MKLLRLVPLLLLSATLWSQTAAPQSTTTTTTTTTKKKATTTKKAPAKKAAKAPSAASEMKTLRDAVNAQQTQIQQLRDQLSQRDQTLQQVQQQLSTLQTQAQQAASTAQQAQSTAQAAQTAAQQAQSTATTAQSTATTTTTNLATTNKKVSDLESPTAIHFRGVTITPGGFLNLNAIWRNHNTNSDVASTFTAFPLSGTANSHLSEFRMTARYSRFSLLAEGKHGDWVGQGYGEIDFEGAAPSANENITNSFQPRIRLLYVNAENKNNGWAFMGGHNWSLVTPNRKGIGNNFAIPLTIDGSIFVGFHYARQGGFRVTKTAKSKVWAISFAVENPETTFANGTCNTIAAAGQTCTLPAGTTSGFPTGLGLGNVGGLSTSTTNTPNNAGAFAAAPSTDAAPDVIFKVAFDPKWGHYEVGFIGRTFRDRVIRITGVPNGGTNLYSYGGGITFNGILPIVAKKVDFMWSTMFGRGLGRYGPGGGTDVTIKPDGSLAPIKAAQVAFGIETHPTPKWDFVIYGGNEYYGRTQYNMGTVAAPILVGWGFNTSNLNQCSAEIVGALLGACTFQNRDVWEVQPGFWYRFWRGKEGTLNFGMSYAYVSRRPWAGVPASARPSGIEQQVLTALRWYFP
ncbi:MAG: hypothetical protein ACR2IF_04745 [Terriglobales bacterium]